MKENKVGTYSFVAEPFHVDFTGRLFMGGVGQPFAQLCRIPCHGARFRYGGTE